MKFKGFIFDFNGVLWWDSHLQENAWREFAKKKRGKDFGIEEMRIHMHGRPNKDIIEYLLGREVDGEKLDRLTEEKETVYRNICLSLGNGFKLSPGAIELLDFLVDNKIPHTIATSSEINNIKFFFESLNLQKWFDFNDVVYDDGTLPGKPAPDIYLRASDRLRLAPEQCVVVEDAFSGIRSAQAAGIGLVIALGHKEKHKELIEEAGADEAISNLGEIKKDELFFRI
ncbi:MAG: HAD family phosphatase [Candidatus Gribaldobacteria bacterium]|nr:HAD family phosphatase [Candidatus Gribaldobacteria bacterium]